MTRLNQRRPRSHPGITSGDSNHVYDGEEYEYDCNWNDEDDYIYDASVDDDDGLNLRAFVKQLLEIIWQR